MGVDIVSDKNDYMCVRTVDKSGSKIKQFFIHSLLLVLPSI
jgi:hypothetical protein